ncbi:MAG: AgmX/PglI C-terminal domain-containing protein [Bdellovibrionales bacterium]|nr:AgmX/PglI C-terminal domain-containing protein [Bdellovibrionales bacterium]
MNHERYAFLNSDNKIVRNIIWQGSSAVIIRVVGSNRIELVSETSLLLLDKDTYDIVSKVTKAQIKSKPLKINSKIKLVQVRDNHGYIPSVYVKEESDNYNNILRWTTLGHMLALLVLLLVGYFYKEPKPNEAVVVKVFKQNRNNVNNKVVKVSKNKIIKKKKYKYNKKRKLTKIGVVSKSIKRNKRIKNKGNNKVSDNSLLAALNGLHSGAAKSNLDLGSINGKKAKVINTGKVGGHQRVVIGKGLVASQVGSGANIGAVEGFKTKGQGGGNNGYGRISISGSAKYYTAPLREEAFIEGGLDKSQIDAVVKRNLGQVIYCYEKGLQKEPDLSGRVAVRFIIAASGKVSFAKVHSTSLRSKPVESCIVSKLKTWKFPKPYGQVNVKVTYPFSLRRLGATHISKRSL